MDKFFLEKDNAALLIIDIQERLADVMKAKEPVIKSSLHLVELAKLINIPVIVTEQYPKGLGHTVEEIRNALALYQPIEKMTFSCCEENNFLQTVQGIQKKQLILVGMETHVCVLQTCLGLLRDGYAVHVVKDAICSRTKENWETGIAFMRDAGAVITSTEIVLFQLLKIAGTSEFKTMVKRIK
jgi:nicotinamidase-related amidase